MTEAAARKALDAQMLHARAEANYRRMKDPTGRKALEQFAAAMRSMRPAMPDPEPMPSELRVDELLMPGGTHHRAG